MRKLCGGNKRRRLKPIIFQEAICVQKTENNYTEMKTITDKFISNPQAQWS